MVFSVGAMSLILVIFHFKCCSVSLKVFQIVPPYQHDMVVISTFSCLNPLHATCFLCLPCFPVTWQVSESREPSTNPQWSSMALRAPRPRCLTSIKSLSVQAYETAVYGMQNLANESCQVSKEHSNEIIKSSYNGSGGL